MQSVWEAYLEVQEGKKLSAKQKKHFDKDNDGDIDDKDMAMLNKEETESVEQVDELSKKTLGNYIKTANDQTAAAGVHVGANMDGHPTQHRVAKRNMAKIDKRQAGIKTAVSKLTREANEPADPVKGAPARKGDKKKSDPMAKCVPGDPEKHSKPTYSESTDAYQDAQKRIADKQKNANISSSDKEKLGKLADLMKKEETEEPKLDFNAPIIDFASFMEKVANDWPYGKEFNFKGKNKPAQDMEPLGQSKTEPNTKQYDKHNESSTEPEGLVDKESPKSKEFIRQHQKSDKEFEVKYDQSVDDVSKAGADAVKSQAPNRRGTDQLDNGDKKPVKGNKAAN